MIRQHKNTVSSHYGCVWTLAILLVAALPIFAAAQTAKLYHAEYPGNRTFNSNLNASNLQTLSTLGIGKIDVEVDTSQGYVYWTGFTSQGIYRSRLDGSAPTTLYNLNFSPFGLDIDREKSRLFIGGWSNRQLQCGTINGSGTLSNLFTAPNLITDVEYNSADNRLYFGVFGSGIWRVQLGNGCTTVGTASRIIADGGRPYGLTLDAANNRLWWTNATENRISRANLDGSGANLNFCQTGNFLAGIAHLNGTLYYSDYGNDNTYRTPDNSCNPTPLGNSGPNRPWGIEAVDFNPSVDLEKSTNGVDADTAPGPQLLTGDTVTWEYRILNTGNSVLRNPSLIDSDLGAIAGPIAGDTDNDGELDAGELWLYRQTGTATPGQYNNTGTLTASTSLNTTDSYQANGSDDSHYIGVNVPQLQSFNSSTTDGTYGPASTITVLANYDQSLAAGSSLELILNNGVSVTLASVSGSSLSGSYTVGATASGQDISDLSVASISSENAESAATGGTQTGSTVPNPPNNLGDSSNIAIDVTAPTLAEVTPVPTPGSNTNPQYTYSSSEVGTNLYGGDCDGVDNTANAGNNTDTLDSDGAGAPFAEGVYSNCRVTVTDLYGNVSAPLAISPFTIDLTAPALISFTSTTADGTYGPGSVINLTATYDSALGSGSNISVTLNNGVSISLSTVTGSEVRGTYTVGATGSGQDTADLSVALNLDLNPFPTVTATRRVHQHSRQALTTLVIPATSSSIQQRQLWQK